jgi:hypothetical protein
LHLYDATLRAPTHLSKEIATHESEIRVAVHRHVSTQFAHDPTARIVDEVGVHEGRGRVDVAVINGHLHGYEIKSEFDSLTRLPQQLVLFGSVFEYLWLVIAPKHLTRVVRTSPDWVGVMVATDGDPDLELRRPAGPTASWNPLAMASLMWRDETLAFLRGINAASGVGNAPRRDLWNRLVDVLPERDLRAAVRATLKARDAWGHPIDSS